MLKKSFPNYIQYLLMANVFGFFHIPETISASKYFSSFLHWLEFPFEQILDFIISFS